MSHKAASADASAEAETRPSNPARRQRVWQLVSELVQVLLSRDAQLASGAESPPAIPSPVHGAPEADSPQRPFRPWNAACSAPMSRVWQDVQARTLRNRLRPRPSVAAVATPVPCPEDAASPAGGLEQNLDWRPFLLARILDDFTHSPHPD
jgi:hypothetical protein